MSKDPIRITGKRIISFCHECSCCHAVVNTQAVIVTEIQVIESILAGTDSFSGADAADREKTKMIENLRESRQNRIALKEYSIGSWRDIEKKTRGRTSVNYLDTWCPICKKVEPWVTDWSESETLENNSFPVFFDDDQRARLYCLQILQEQEERLKQQRNDENLSTDGLDKALEVLKEKTKEADNANQRAEELGREIEELQSARAKLKLFDFKGKKEIDSEISSKKTERRKLTEEVEKKVKDAQTEQALLDYKTRNYECLLYGTNGEVEMVYDGVSIAYRLVPLKKL